MPRKRSSSARSRPPLVGGWRRSLLAASVVVLAVFALYSRTLSFEFSYLDDDVLVLQDQSFLAEPGSVWGAFGRPYFAAGVRDHAYYRPLVTASLALDAQLSGVEPAGYHLTNVLLHALSSALLFFLLRRFVEGDAAPLFGALLFALHPALCEAVAWIPGRTDSLLTVFALLSWLFLERSPGSRSWLARAVHLGGWLAALLSKELALVLPLVFVAELVFVRRRPLRSVLAPWPLLGWAAVAAVYLVSRAAALGQVAGAQGLEWMSLVRNSPVLLASVGKLALPVQLSVLSTRDETWLWPGVLAGALFAFLFFRSKSSSERATLGFWLLCLLAFLLPSLPASSVLTLENRLYLPAVALVGLGASWRGYVGGSAAQKVAAALLVLTALGARSFAYAGEFRDRRAFAEAAVRGSPGSSLAHRNLGVTYQLAGELDAARREYLAALAADPREPVAHNNLGVMLLRQGLMADAEQELRKELEINPQYPEAHHNLALVLRARGRPHEAAQHWQESLAR